MRVSFLLPMPLPNKYPAAALLLVTTLLCQDTAAFNHDNGRKVLGLSSFNGLGLKSSGADRIVARVVSGRRGARSPVVTFAAFDESGKVDVFDPFNRNIESGWGDINDRGYALITTTDTTRKERDDMASNSFAAPLAALTVVNMAVADKASAETISQGMYNPDTFKPVCSASDGFYRFLQGATKAVVGDESFVEYGPLIAGGLLRVRLELCVVESFFNEAVGPFIAQNGISWILPLHETVETFIAGTIFALATTFILVGSTKLISVIVLYGDVFIGGPCRLFGGFFFDRALGKPVTLDVGIGPWKKRLVGPPNQADGGDGGISAAEVGGGLDNLSPTQIPVVVVSGAVKYLGEGSKILREGIESLDLFVGRYLVVLATGYILLKFVHFKIFPDFPPF
mmetsp:Transcript_24799/g.53675  ORF Transcript_24799/g.53675 Transcript_24799/m.53675 type:complete len:397 (+) Transcript_24799:110-1300(+)